LFSNPGLFYAAITLLSRNGKGDVEAAKISLQMVIDKNLEGSKVAADLIKKLQ
jgi:hypothetical protein